VAREPAGDDATARFLQMQQAQHAQAAAAAAAMGGVVVMGPAGPMVLPAHALPAMGAYPYAPQMMMMGPVAAAAYPPAHAASGAGASYRPSVGAKDETPAGRRARVEAEKQALIREFKKKTREAALVRFRQKRRERRFGKLIRYDCRKVLAEKRPRVKGRFVRVKDGDDGEDDDDAESAASAAPGAAPKAAAADAPSPADIPQVVPA
jgi:hypothetical protein